MIKILRTMNKSPQSIKRYLNQSILYQASEFKKYEDVYQRKLQQQSRNNVQYNFRFNRVQNLQINLNENMMSKSITNIPLDNLGINRLPDTQDFNLIPELQHNLAQHLDGKLLFSDKSIGEIPKNISKQFLDSLSTYTKPSNDTKLLNLCRQNNCRYFSSTSNVSQALVHLYFIFSNFRRPYFKNVMDKFTDSKSHMVSFRKPSTFILQKKSDNLYAFDSEKPLMRQQNQILMKMGTFMEYLFTTPMEQVKQQLAKGKCTNPRQSYNRYISVNKRIFLRSQIDCKQIDPITKQTHVFQIKTRAACPIRYDVLNYADYLDYQISSIRGKYFSFQRQYYDLIRGGFLKYAFQIKTGDMSGAFIAYHNTQKIFGYEYVPIREIGYRLFGDQYNLDVLYMCTNQMLYQIFEVLKQEYGIPQNDQQGQLKRLKIGMYANNTRRCLTVFVQKMIFDEQYQMLPKQYEQDISTYFNKFKKLRNPVYKYEFQFFVYKNNILLNSPQVYFTPKDTIKIDWQWGKIGMASKNDYISFLTDAYKLQGNFGMFSYSGIWAKTDQ